MHDWVGSSSPMNSRRVVETWRCIPRAGSRRDGLDGSGHFKTVQAAINRVPTKNKKRIIIYVKKGVYTEKVRIPSNKKYITLKGESASLTTIQWGDTASTLGKNGKPLSTYGSASVAVEADNFIALDISFKVNKYIIKLTLYFLSLNSHLFHNVYFIEHSSPPHLQEQLVGKPWLFEFKETKLPSIVAISMAPKTPSMTRKVDITTIIATLRAPLTSSSVMGVHSLSYVLYDLH